MELRTKNYIPGTKADSPEAVPKGMNFWKPGWKLVIDNRGRKTIDKSGEWVEEKEVKKGVKRRRKKKTDNVYRCGLCEAEFATKKQIEDHLLGEHEGQIT